MKTILTNIMKVPEVMQVLNNNYKKIIFEKQLHCCNSMFH